MEFSINGRNFEVGSLGSLNEVLPNGERKLLAIVRKSGEFFRATDSLGGFTQDRTQEGAARLYVEFNCMDEEEG